MKADDGCALRPERVAKRGGTGAEDQGNPGGPRSRLKSGTKVSTKTAPVVVKPPRSCERVATGSILGFAPSRADLDNLLSLATLAPPPRF